MNEIASAVKDRSGTSLPSGTDETELITGKPGEDQPEEVGSRLTWEDEIPAD